MNSSIDIKILHITSQGRSINKNKGLGFSESSGFSVVFLAQLKTEVVNTRTQYMYKL